MLMIGVVLILSSIISVARISLLHDKQRNKIADIVFTTFEVICFTGLGLWGFIGHVFAADIVAQSIGWASGNPFQTEVGIANLAIAVTAFLCIWFKDGYRIGATLVNSIWLCGAGVLHIKEVILSHNYNIGNTLIIGSDIGIPVLVLILLSWYYRENIKELERRTLVHQ